MSRNVMTITKWLPIESEERKALYIECKQLKRSTQTLIEEIGSCLYEIKNIAKLHHNISNCGHFLENIANVVDSCFELKNGFNKAFFKLNTCKPHQSESKVLILKNILWKMKLRLSHLLHEYVSDIAYLFAYYGEQILTLILKLADTFNQCLQLDAKYGIIKTIFVCSNTCPYLMYPARKISITKLLQILAQNRSEICCHKLIDCLLETYKFYDGHDEDNGSDNSSVEIYRALTRHMSPPSTALKPPNSDNVTDAGENESFVNMDELINYEVQNVLNLLGIAFKVAPLMLGDDGIKKSIVGERKLGHTARNKVLNYYQQILWGEVGIFLEHVILWWGSEPLSTKPPHSSHHLREWINQFTPSAEIPAYILSALCCLSDALGVHVTSTSWDQHFRLALVASKSTCPDTGRLFCEMLYDLTSLSNQCEITKEWIVGAPLDELPLVEQIPVLHRLDHSIHITRLWAISETMKLANNWNVESFFMITHCDIVNCLSQLNSLRLSDHTAAIEKGGLGVHVHVCANMREKLVSEVKTNICKLMETPNQCVKSLASVCRTISLANLQMIFPAAHSWRYDGSELPNTPNDYVGTYLDQVLTPVLAATENHEISNMILRIMCEAWLDHIYIHKIIFSQCGAVKLLMDFGFVSTWIINCNIITQSMRKKMLKNEILKRCEGVGKLLLRSRGEHIKMADKNKKADVNSSPKSENNELMPAEMYVPNQEQWLELRANRRNTLLTSLCCIDSHI